MNSKQATKIARKYSTEPPRGHARLGQKMHWENSKQKLVFVPDHAYTTEGRLFLTDKATGKVKEL